jgi:O-antigen/teichoic acid export membrane protein
MLIGKEEYVLCAELVPLLILTEYLLYTNYFLEGPLFVYRHTLQKFYIGFASTILILLLLFLLTPLFGGTGAAVSVAAGYAFMCLASFLAAQRLRQIHYQWKTVIFFSAEAILFYFLAEQTNFWLVETPMLFRVFAKSTFLLLYLLSLWRVIKETKDYFAAPPGKVNPI